MTDVEWARVRELFERATALPSTRRLTFVRTEARGEPELIAEVERLLEASDDDETFLRSPDRAELIETMTPPSLSPGAVVGDYRIQRVVGSGGMGTVFEATQERPARTVALKIMRLGNTGPGALERFLLEADILARLRHPGIATIYEVGTHRDASGFELPFIAMEFVQDARDVVTYAREQELDTDARLELVLAICAAVHHGHQKTVVHRDLKPGNVLVDDEGRPRVIDYGVARVAEERDFETEAGYLVGTLQYLAPEQLQGEPADVVSDVYALGVILYELLTGEQPYDVRKRSFTEALELICHEPPPRPSSVATGLPQDLDWITLRALAKEPERRYASAHELAQDIERYRSDEPVLAGPPSNRYRVRKFVRRHRVGVTAAAVFLVTLVAGVVGTTLGLVEAREARSRAEAAKELAHAERDRALAAEEAARVAEEAARREEARALDAEDAARREEARALAAEADAVRERDRALDAEELATLSQLAEAEQRREAESYAERARAALGFVESAFNRLDPRTGGHHEVTVEEFLNELTAALDEAGPMEATVEETVTHLVANAYMSLDDFAAAEPYFARMEELASRGGNDDVALFFALGRVGAILRSGRPHVARELVTEHLEQVREYGVESRLYHSAALNAALYESLSGNHARALPYFELVVANNETILGPDHIESVNTRNDYANCLMKLGRIEEADREFEAAVELSREVLSEDHPDLYGSIGNLGSTRMQLGRLLEAEKLLREAYSGIVRIMGPDTVGGFRSAANLALVLKKLGKLDESEQLYREAIAIGEVIFGPVSPDMLVVKGNLGTLLHASGRYADAWAVLSELHEIKTQLAPTNLDRIMSANNLGGLLEDMGELEKAEELYREALRGELQRLGATSPNAAFFRANLASALIKQGRFDEAEEQLRLAVDIYEETLPAEHPRALRARSQLCSVLMSRGRFEDAIPVLEALLVSHELMGTANSVEAFDTGAKLVTALRDVGSLDEAARLRDELLERTRRHLGESHPQTQRLLELL